MSNNNIHMARKLSQSYRYIDDLLIFNSDGLMDEHKTNMYPPELVLNKENKTDDHVSFLDIDMTVQHNTHTLYTRIYDKCDDFNFAINNFPNLSGNIHAK